MSEPAPETDFQALEAAEAEASKVKTQEEAEAVYIRHGVDAGTAAHLAAHQFGKHRGGVIER